MFRGTGGCTRVCGKRVCDDRACYERVCYEKVYHEQRISSSFSTSSAVTMVS